MKLKMLLFVLFGFIQISCMDEKLSHREYVNLIEKNNSEAKRLEQNLQKLQNSQKIDTLEKIVECYKKISKSFSNLAELPVNSDNLSFYNEESLKYLKLAYHYKAKMKQLLIEENIVIIVDKINKVKIKLESKGKAFFELLGQNVGNIHVEAAFCNVLAHYYQQIAGYYKELTSFDKTFEIKAQKYKGLASNHRNNVTKYFSNLLKNLQKNVSAKKPDGNLSIALELNCKEQ